MQEQITTLQLTDDGIFPNNTLPVLIYKAVLNLPALLPAADVRNLFESNNWTNAWDSGIFEYHHYHSITHEVLGVYAGGTTLQLGGAKGPLVKIKKGDVMVLPAGVAHRNLGNEGAVKCIGAYPDGRSYDMNYGKAGERPKTDQNIQLVPLPALDPVFGSEKGLIKLWL